MKSFGGIRNSEGLPFLVNEPTRSGFRLTRWWRSVPRLKKFALLMLLLTSMIVLLYIKKSDEAVLSTHAQIEAEGIQENINRVRAFDPELEEEKPAASVAKVIEAPPIPTLPKFLGPQNDRQRAVRDAFRHAWAGYKKYAWGHDQLKPVSHSYSDWFDTGLTIVDSLDTAVIMGLEEEVKEGLAWIRDELSFEKDRYVNLFETTIRVLGGLLSLFHLTGDQMLVTRAADLGDRLLGAFVHSPTVVPLSDVNLKTKHAKSPQWSNEASLSEVSTLQLEFRDLSRLTGNSTYEEMAFKVSEHIHEIGCSKYEGLCEMFIIPSTGKFKELTTITFGARADSYYEYLFKQWIQTGKTIPWLEEDYKQAMSSMESKLLRFSEPNKLAFVGELLSGQTYSPKMDHLVCFLSGTLALGTKNGMPSRHMDLAKGLGKACRAMYENPTGLGPEIAYYNMLPGHTEDLTIKPLDAHCLLRPEAIEAWFYLYRLTGDPVYQDWGWRAFEAIEKYAKLSDGYSSVNSVKKIPTTYRDLMESFYLAETLKYLYLLLADDQSELPLDQWVFNTEAHPLPIRSH